MELVLKKPTGKPPCICIKFDNSYKASSHYSILPNEYNMYPLSIKMELVKGKLDLIVIVEGYKIPYRYADIKFHPEQLKQFLESTNGADKYSFCHIITQSNKDKVVDTIQKRLLWVLQIDKVELVQEF